MPITQYTVRASWILEGEGHGAKETFFFQQGSNSLDLALQTWLQAYPKRLALAAPPGMAKAVELSMEYDATGQPVLNDSTIQYKFDVGTYPTDQANYELAVLLKLQNDLRTKRRNCYLRMFPDDIELGGGFYRPPDNGPWTTRLNAYRTSLLNTIQVGWINQVRSTPVNLNSVTQNPDFTVTFVTTANLFTGPQIGKRIRVRCYTARVKSQLSGSLVVVPTSATEATTVNKIAIEPKPLTGWTLSTYDPTWVPGTFLDAQKVVEKKMGKPLLEPPGRLKAKAKT